MHNVNGPNISMTILGIKCDNPSCDFADESIKVEDYHLWLNKECPKCASNLLTQADYEQVKYQLQMAETINQVILPQNFKHPYARMQGSFDGSGKVNYSKLELEDA